MVVREQRFQRKTKDDSTRGAHLVFRAGKKERNLSLMVRVVGDGDDGGARQQSRNNQGLLVIMLWTWMEIRILVGRVLEDAERKPNSIEWVMR